MPKFIKFSLRDTSAQAVEESLVSIHKNGLIPLNKIPLNVPSNTVTQSQNVDGDICINYVNLDGATKSEANLALNTAIEEEYTGVYGICLERQWPFQRFSSSKLVQLEATERLMQSVVFILTPPLKLPMITDNVDSAEKPTTIAFYELDGEGFSQARDRSVVTGKKIAYSNHITEIKTSHCFSKEEIHAVLVPEHLCATAQKIFTDVAIISVPTKVLILNTLPKILSYFHDEHITSPLNITAPDYLSVVNNFCKEKNITCFSLHAVRLHTCFDFTVRPISCIAKHKQLISKTQARVINVHDNVWIAVHKKFSSKQEDVINRLRSKQCLPKDIITKIEKGSAVSRELYNQLIAAKGNLTLSNIYKELSEAQILLLQHLEVNIVKLDDYQLVQFSPTVAQKVNKVVEHFELIENAIIKIQAHFRGLRTRLLFKQAKEKHHIYEQARQDCTSLLDKPSTRFRSSSFFEQVRNGQNQLLKVQEEDHQALEKLNDW